MKLAYNELSAELSANDLINSIELELTSKTKDKNTALLELYIILFKQEQKILI